MENFPKVQYLPVALVVHNLLLVYSTRQYSSTIVIIVYDSKCHRTKKNFIIL